MMRYRWGCSVSGTLPQLLLVLISITSGAGSPMTSPTIFDWDIAVSQANGVALISTSSPTQDPREITFPIPKLAPGRNSSQLMSVVSLDGDISANMERQLISHQDLERDWRHFEVKSLASDAPRNLLYFSHSITTSTYKLTNLCVFNLTALETKLILQTSSGSIDSLVLHDGDLYFMEGRTRAILKVPTSAADFLQPNSLLPTVVKQFQGNAPNGFVIGPSPFRTLFWSANNPSTIYFEEGEVEKVLVSKDLKKAHGLHIFGSHLYFMNTPQFGPQKKIERVSLRNLSQREVVINFEDMNQVPTAFTSDCEFLYWTDTVSKALWKIPLSPDVSKGSKTVATKMYTSNKQNRHFTVLFPHAVTTRHQYLDSPKCIPKGPEVTSTPLPLVDAKAQSDTLDSVLRPPPTSPPASESLGIYSTTKAPPTSVPAKIIDASVPPPTNPLLGSVKFCGEEQSLTVCLNGATCLYLSGNRLCLCPEGFSGPKCELDWNQGLTKTMTGTTGPGENVEPCSATNAFLLLIVTATGGIAVGVSVLAIILGVKVHRLNRKPKVHRRFIVARPGAQRPRHPSGNLCEMIDIENCCNMTICETPCYDSGTGRVSLVTDSLGQEDKERLLDY